MAAVTFGSWFIKVFATTLGETGAFILTRPLGATLGDLLGKPVASGSLNFGRWMASLVLLGCVVALIAFTPQRAAHKGEGA
ncbi:MAG: hypothetical protein ABJA61_06425 [Caldimonas sp.]